MELIHSFSVGEHVQEGLELASTNTRDVLVAGQEGLAVFSGDGFCRYKRTLPKDPNGRGVAMDHQGNIIVTGNVRSLIKCKSCEGSICRLKVIQHFNYDLDQGLGDESNYFLTTKCTSGRHQIQNVCLSQTQLDRVAICGVGALRDFHTVLCDIGNKCLYVFRHSQIVEIIGNAANPSHPQYLQFPHIITSLSTGDIVVGDYLAKKIKIFSIEGKLLNEFGEGVPGGVFPHGIAVDSKDRIIVADKDNHRVLMFDNIGFLLQRLIRDTIEDDLDIRPISVAVKKSESGDKVYVLLKGLPGSNFAQVRVFILDGDAKWKEAVDKGAGPASHGSAPPSYNEAMHWVPTK